MVNPIRFFLFLTATVFLFNCGDDIFKDSYSDFFSDEEKVWLNDGNGDGVADSLHVYANGCNDPIKECLKTAQENKEKEAARVRDSLKLTEVRFSQQDGSFYKKFQVKITTEGDGLIRYTTNGAEPSEKSRVYEGPVKITATTVLKARTFSQSNVAGPVKTAEYELKVQKPAATKKAGTYTGPIKTALVCETDKAPIFYTLDGSMPSVSSLRFRDSLEIPNTVTIKARAMRDGWTSSDTLEVHYKIFFPGIVAGPVFKPEGDIYHQPQEVGILSEEGTEIRYTIDGKAPDSASKRYTGKIKVDSGMTIQAIAIVEGKGTSAPATAKYILLPSKPEFNPASGDYDQEQSIVIKVKSPGGVEIHYTTDGQIPGKSSDKYKGPVLVTQSMTLKARAFYKNWEPSETEEARYTVNIPGKVSAPFIEPPGGPFSDSMLVNISTDENAAKIYYTTNGEEPSESDSLFKSAFFIYDSKTIRAIAVTPGGKASGSTVVTFTKLNRAPLFAETGAQSVNENELLSFEISATDADADDLAYSMLAPPVPGSGPVFEPGTRTFSWTPTYADAGKYVAEFEVTDNAKRPGQDTLLVDIIVSNVNVDSLVVRCILDSNGFYSLPVDTNICEYAGERIARLYLNSNRIHGQLTSLPAEIGKLTELRTLQLYHNRLGSLPEEIGNLINLTELYIENNHLDNLPPSIGKLINLKELSAWNNSLRSLPIEIGNLSHLQYLYINNNQLSTLPSSIGNLVKLEHLWADGNQLTNLPEEIGNLVNLTYLHLYRNQLSSLPSEIVNLKKLKELDVSHNRLCNLSGTIEKWIDTYTSILNYYYLQSCPPP